MVYPQVSTSLVLTTCFEPCSWIEKQELWKSGNRKDDSRNKRKQKPSNKNPDKQKTGQSCNFCAKTENLVVSEVIKVVSTQFKASEWNKGNILEGGLEKTVSDGCLSSFLEEKKKKIRGKSLKRDFRVRRTLNNS